MLGTKPKPLQYQRWREQSHQLENTTSSFEVLYFLTFSEVIASCARIAILLKVREVLHHDSLLLRSDGSGALPFHQIEHSLAVLTFSCVALVFVLRERLLCDEIGIAQLAHQGPADGGIVCKGPQLTAINLRTRHI